MVKIMNPNLDCADVDTHMFNQIENLKIEITELKEKLDKQRELLEQLAAESGNIGMKLRIGRVL